MRDYGKISTTIWNSRKFRSLPNEDSRLLYLYLHTCKHVNSVGCFELPDGYALADLNWTVKRYRLGIDTLCIANLIAFDTGENLVRIIGYLDHDPFNGPKHAIGAIRIAAKLPDCIEKTNLFNELMAQPYGAHNADVKAFFDTLSIPYRFPEPEPEPDIKKESSATHSLRVGVSPLRFDDFWNAYPHRGASKKGRKPAEQKYSVAIRSGTAEQAIIEGAERYGTDAQVLRGFAKDPATWLHQAGWLDEVERIQSPPINGFHPNPLKPMEPVNGIRTDSPSPRPSHASRDRFLDEIAAVARSRPPQGERQP